jgi:hypothetical protein
MQGKFELKFQLPSDKAPSLRRELIDLTTDASDHQPMLLELESRA